MKFRFQIQADSEVPASTQLLEQICYAIASGQFPAGYQLPSTRALAMQTGLHRNTVSKVYRQLEQWGFVDAQAGSGVYVRTLGRRSPTRSAANLKVEKAVDELLHLGCSLEQARDLMLAEIDWRLRCGARAFVTFPSRDIGVGALMQQELLQQLGLETQLVPLEQLAETLAQTGAATVITSRYFAEPAEAVAAHSHSRVVPIDINQFTDELNVIRTLPKDSCLGIVCLSSGILRIAGVMAQSLRGDEILVLTAQVDDRARLRAVIRSAQTIIADQASFAALSQAVERLRPELIRQPQLLCAENYISAESLRRLQRELNLAPPSVQT